MAIGPSTQDYTWQSFKGDLHLYQQEGKYHLRYETKDQIVTEILEENIEGFSLKGLPSEINDFCQDYFFEVRRNGDTLSVDFFESADIHNFTSEAAGQTTKCMGSIGIGFNKLEKRKEIIPVTEGPNFRRIRQGLNFEGKCQNKVCEAFNNYVFIPKGLGEFRIAEDRYNSKCPSCDTPIPVKSLLNLGFWNCHFIVKGRQIDPEDKEVNEPGESGKNTYTTFQQGDDCTWAFLDITVTAPQKKEAAGSGKCNLF